MFLHSEHMTFAQKVIEGDNNSGKKTQICRNCHKRHTEFLQKKIGIESGGIFLIGFVQENGNKQILPYTQNEPTSDHYGGKSYQGSEENQYWT